MDSERCYPDDPGGVTETVALLAAAGAAGFSIEDYDPATGAIDDIDLAAARVAEAAEAAHALDEPLVLTGRAENHIRGVDDLDDTIARLSAYRDAGADVVYAPGLTRSADIARVVAVGIPVNVLALPGGAEPRASSSRSEFGVSPPGACWPARPMVRCSQARASSRGRDVALWREGALRETLEAAFGREGSAE